MAYPNQYKTIQTLIETILVTARMLGYKIDTHTRKENTRIRYTYSNEDKVVNIYHYKNNDIKVMKDGFTHTDIKYIPQRKKVKILNELLQEI